MPRETQFCECCDEGRPATVRSTACSIDGEVLSTTFLCTECALRIGIDPAEAARILNARQTAFEKNESAEA